MRLRLKMKMKWRTAADPVIVLLQEIYIVA